MCMLHRLASLLSCGLHLTPFMLTYMIMCGSGNNWFYMAVSEDKDRARYHRLGHAFLHASAHQLQFFSVTH